MAAIGSAGVAVLLAFPGEYPRTGEIESNEPSALLVLVLEKVGFRIFLLGFPSC